MARYWLLTWTTYGTWLPGDRRGFVSTVKDGPGPEIRHNVPGTPYDSDMPGLRRSAVKLLKCPPIFLNKAQAKTVYKQLLATSEYRCWQAFAIAVMSNHIHMVVGVPGDPDPSVLLRDFKSYASRALNQNWSKPESETWWTESGSRRKLPDENAFHAAIEYVRRQQHPLIVWINDPPGERPA